MSKQARVATERHDHEDIQNFDYVVGERTCYAFLALSSPSKTVHNRNAPDAGAVLGGKYKLVRIIGEGGMGIVYEGEHIGIGQRVAIKMLLPETVDQGDVLKRFHREARAAARLKSRHVARVTDVDLTPDGYPYMVMELLEGSDLGELLEFRVKLPYPEAVDYVLQACAAIIEAHDVPIIHRDLKPENLFLSRGPEGQIIKMLDFGISKVAGEASRLTNAEAMMGTPLYMSPEQIRSARDVDTRTDIWSLGVILYELISGTAPFNGTTTQVAAAIVTDEIPPILTSHGAPPELQAVVLRALTKDRNVRFQTARELAIALLPFVAASSVGAQAIDAALRQSLGPTSAASSMSSMTSIAPPMRSSGNTLNPTTEIKPGAKGSSRVVMGLAVGTAALLAAGVVAFIAIPHRPWGRGAAIADPTPSVSVAPVNAVVTNPVVTSAPSSSPSSPSTQPQPVSTPVTSAEAAASIKAPAGRPPVKVVRSQPSATPASTGATPPTTAKPPPTTNTAPTSTDVPMPNHI